MIRRFNWTVTEQIGALEESFLGRDRPLGASRLLWEIGEDGADLHELRGRLGLGLREPARTTAGEGRPHRR